MICNFYNLIHGNRKEEKWMIFIAKLGKHVRSIKENMMGEFDVFWNGANGLENLLHDFTVAKVHNMRHKKSD